MYSCDVLVTILRLAHLSASAPGVVSKLPLFVLSRLVTHISFFQQNKTNLKLQRFDYLSPRKGRGGGGGRGTRPIFGYK